LAYYESIERKNLIYFRKKKGLYYKLKCAVRDSFSPEEFEARWKEAVAEHDASDNNRINYRYNIKSYWVPAFFMESFYPFSSTTGRSESTNSMFKGYVAHKDTIVNFFGAYENIQEKNLSDFDRCRYISELKEPSQCTYNGLEGHAATIYTNTIFQKVQREIKKGTGYGVSEVTRDRIFQLTRKVKYENPEFGKEKYTMQVLDDKTSFSCSCKKLESNGIDCCHMWKIAERLDLLLVPDSFVKYRWTIKADQDVALVVGQELVIGGSKTSDAVQYCIMMADVSHFCSTLAGNKRGMDLFIKEFADMKNRINTTLKIADAVNGPAGNATTVQTRTEQGDGSANVVTYYQDPPRAAVKGPTKRKNGAAEKVLDGLQKKKAQEGNITTKPIRRCSKCKSTTHDKKNARKLER
jgi:hypothetical protein